MTDTITVPRALLEQALKALEYMNVTAEHRVDSRVPEQSIAALRSALEQPQQEPLADALRLLRTAIQTGHPEYGPADWIDMIDTALEGLPQDDTALLRHCLELIEGEWPADDPAAGPLMVKLRQRLGAVA